MDDQINKSWEDLEQKSNGVTPPFVNNNPVNLGSTQNPIGSQQNQQEAPQATQHQTPNQAEPQPHHLTHHDKKHIRLAWLLPLILLIVLIVGSVALIALTETGVINWGLEKIYKQYGIEKIWGGTPIDLKQALSVSNTKVSGINSYNFTHTGKVDSNVTLSTDNQVIASTINLTQDGKILLPNSAYLKNTSSATAQNTASSAPFISANNMVSEVIVGDKLYLRTNLDNTNSQSSWDAFNYSDSVNRTQIVSNINVMQQFTNLNNYIVGNGIYLGQEKINGQIYYHWGAQLSSNTIGEMSLVGWPDIESLVKDYKVKQQINTNQVYGDFYIAQNSKTLTQVIFTAQAINFNTTVKSSSAQVSMDLLDTYNFNGFNQVTAINIPDVSNVVTPDAGTFTTKSAIYWFLQPVQKKTADAIRKADLANIKTALDNYKTANGSYPVSLTVTKTDAADTPLNVLVPDYLSKLPLDPNTPTYYYGYKSDGNTFELTCVLDDSTDSQGAQAGSFYIYKLTN